MCMAWKAVLLSWWNSGKLTVGILCSAQLKHAHLFAMITEMRPLFTFISPSLNPKWEKTVKDCYYLLGTVPVYPRGCPEKQLQRSWNLMRLLLLMVWH